MPRTKKGSLSAAVSAEIQSKFDLSKFKNKKGLDKNIKYNDILEKLTINSVKTQEEVDDIPKA